MNIKPTSNKNRKRGAGSGDSGLHSGTGSRFRLALRKNSTARRSLSHVLLTVLGLLMLGGAVATGILLEKNTRLRSVTFEGAVLTPESALSQAFRAETGTLIDSLQLGELARPLKALPHVKDVRYRLQSRGRLRVEVIEREPIGILVDESPMKLIDAQGVVMPVVDDIVLDLPLLTGIPLPNQTNPDDSPMPLVPEDSPFANVRDFLAAASRDPLRQASISEITWSDEKGVVVMSTERSLVLLFGRENRDGLEDREDMESKWRHWEEFSRQVLPWDAPASYRTIDLRFRDQIVARTE